MAPGEIGRLARLAALRPLLAFRHRYRNLYFFDLDRRSGTQPY